MVKVRVASPSSSGRLKIVLYIVLIDANRDRCLVDERLLGFLLGVCPHMQIGVVTSNVGSAV